MQNSIGIFDSGVGGLSVLTELHKLLPKETFIYLADQAYLPYGEKTKEQLVSRVSLIFEFFKQKNTKAVVIACNTATIYTVDEIRKKFDFPIIGTVPVIKTLVNLTKTGKTAVFTTSATAKSEYLKNLINTFAPNINVQVVGGSNLEELVEEGEINTPETKQILKNQLMPLVDNGIDVIALGCTHYPFLRSQIEEIVGPEVTVVDSGGAIARRVNEVLKNEDLLSTQKVKDLYYTTSEVNKFESVATILLGEKVSAQHIKLDFIR